jgi:hypothetical protein
MTWDGSVHLP